MDAKAKFIVIILAITTLVASSAALYFFFGNRNVPRARMSAEVQTNLPDLHIKRIERISVGQWRITIGNKGASCVKESVKIIAVPAYAHPGQSQTLSFNELCPHTQLFRVFSFPPIQEGAPLASVNFFVNPKPSSVIETADDNNQINFTVPGRSKQSQKNEAPK